MTYVESVDDSKPCAYPYPETHGHYAVLNIDQFDTAMTSEGCAIYLPFCNLCNEALAQLVAGIQLPKARIRRQKKIVPQETIPANVDDVANLAEDELRILERAAEHVLSPGIKPPPLPPIAVQEANVAKVPEFPKASWPKSDPKQVSENIKRRNRAIRDGTYARLLEEQESKCACCKKLFVVTPHLDHNHETGAIRGLVCGECNIRYIALADKDPRRMLQAIQYVRKHRGQTTQG